jgi:hypothetical protein
MRCLDLFTGTGSVAQAFEEKGWDVWTLDIDPATEPDFLTDIRDWDFTQFPPGYFDYIHASPVCTHYSRARTTAKTPRNFEEADSLVQAALRIIEYYDPPAWTLENPQSGLLKTRPFMQEVPFLADVDYCQFGAMFRKRTRLWGKIPRGFPTTLCTYNCPFSHAGKHFYTAQRLPSSKSSVQDCSFSVSDLYRIPHRLCLALVDAVEA